MIHSNTENCHVLKWFSVKLSGIFYNTLFSQIGWYSQIKSKHTCIHTDTHTLRSAQLFQTCSSVQSDNNLILNPNHYQSRTNTDLNLTTTQSIILTTMGASKIRFCVIRSRFSVPTGTAGPNKVRNNARHGTKWGNENKT